MWLWMVVVHCWSLECVFFECLSATICAWRFIHLVVSAYSAFWGSQRYALPLDSTISKHCQKGLFCVFVSALTAFLAGCATILGTVVWCQPCGRSTNPMVTVLIAGLSSENLWCAEFSMRCKTTKVVESRVVFAME